MNTAASSQYPWCFFRAGGFDQVRLDSGEDIAHIGELDQKLWFALACPITGLEFDCQTLALIDEDKDGRIRAPELIAAVQWAVSRLKNPDDLLKGSGTLPLSAIQDSTDEGRKLVASARQILATLKKSNGDGVSIEDVTQMTGKLVETVFNGDGVIIPDTASDEATRSVINDIIACLGAETDRSGKPGINQAKFEQFFSEARTYSDWWALADGNIKILPIGAATLPATSALKAVRSKLDDYFTRCSLANFDPRSVGALNREEKEYLAFTAQHLTLASDEITGFPIARVEANRPLPLKEGINPAWADAVAQFDRDAVQAFLGNRPTLTESDWKALLEKLGPFFAWSDAQPKVSAERLGVARIREILSSAAQEKIAALIAEDKKLEPEFTAIAAVERLIRYHRDLAKLCNNFVSFRDFYSRKEKAIFQAGTLYLDQRSCELCLPVEDPGKHAIMASLAGTYLAYCDCFRKGSGEKRQILAAFTNGDSDNLMVGRNGIFYDRSGRDWDATISKIVDNPISIRQAFWAPYKKMARFIQDQINKRAAAADSASMTKAAARIEQAAEQRAVPAAPVPPPPPVPQKFDPGLIAALSVGLAGIGAMVGGILSTFLGLKWMMPLGIIAVILLISGPSMIFAWLKLRRRNLGPILDANGWAVNAKAKINVPFGAMLTRVATLPPGAHCDKKDPYAEKKRHWGLYVTLVLILLLGWIGYRWYLGKLDDSLPKSIRSVTVFGSNAPAFQAPK